MNPVVKTGPTGKFSEAFGIVMKPIQSRANSVSLGECFMPGPELQLSMIIIPCSSGFVIKRCFILCW